MNLLPKLLTNIAGGAGAAALDRYKPEWTQHVGGVAITPGAMAGVGVALALALKLPIPGKEILAELAGGALVVEGVKLAEDQVLPMLGISAAPGHPSDQMGAGAAATVHGLPYGHYRPSDYELQASLMRRAAA